MGLSGFLHLLQDEGRYLRRGVILTVGAHPGVAGRAFDDLIGHHALVLLDHGIGEVAADQPLDGEKCVLWIGHGLALGGLADQALAVVEDRYD